MSPLINRMRVIELLTLILPSKLEIRVGGCFEKCLKNLVILSPCHPYYYPYLTHFPLLCGYIGQILWSQRDRYKRVPLYHVTKYHDVNSAKHKEVISLSLSLSLSLYIYIYGNAVLRRKWRWNQFPATAQWTPLTATPPPPAPVYSGTSAQHDSLDLPDAVKRSPL